MSLGALLHLLHLYASRCVTAGTRQARKSPPPFEKQFWSLRFAARSCRCYAFRVAFLLQPGKGSVFTVRPAGRCDTVIEPPSRPGSCARGERAM